jgi:hemolysin-activating ACP:hemolysin acyltransferase
VTDRDAKMNTMTLPNGGRMRPQDWQCGDELRVVEIIAPFGPVGDGHASIGDAMIAAQCGVKSTRICRSFRYGSHQI